MNKTVFTVIVFFAFAANVSAQIEVSPSENVGIGTNNPQHKLHVVGDAYVTGSFGTIGNVPLTLKVDTILAGFTGSSGYTNMNVSFGYQSLVNLAEFSSVANTAVGYEALRNNLFADNTAVGHQALYNNTWGEMNTANGRIALYNNTVGSFNTATGLGALYYNTTGNHNIAIGYYALYPNETGSNNTAIGNGALGGNERGSNNTAIGFGADVYKSNASNATAIGYGAMAASNQVVIGNTTVTDIGGYANWTTYPSDGRTKKNIQAKVPGLAFINRLQPVTYNLNLDVIDDLQKSDDPKINARRDSLRTTLSPEAREIEANARANKEKIVYSGFIAQDVEKAASSVGYDFSGVDTPENGKGVYGIRYAEFVVPLVKAVQELSEQNDAKDAAIASLQEQFNELMIYARELNKKIEVLERK